MMSSAESKRSKRRRNKRGGGKANRQQKQISLGDQISINQKPPATLTELDLDNIPQPLTQLPRSHDTYLDREHCLLCRRPRPDQPGYKNLTSSDDGKENSSQVPITQAPLWLCPDCRRTVEEDERNSPKGFDPALLLQTQDMLQQPTLISALQNLDGTLSIPIPNPATSQPTSDSTGIVKGSNALCNCESCRERREIAAEHEHSRQQLADCWSELSHVVRCIYMEAGTALADEESSTRLSLPRMKELIHRLCCHDPHQLYLRLEMEVENYVKEMRERLLKQLLSGYATPAQAEQFISMLLEEYTALCSAAQTLSAVLEELEKDHLRKFNLTWLLHNKHLFHAIIYTEPALHDKLSLLIEQLRLRAGQKEVYIDENFTGLLHRYLRFDDEMSVVSVVWRDCQQLVEDYSEEQQEILKTKQQMLRDDWEFHKKLAEKGMQRAQQQAMMARTQPDGKPANSPSINSSSKHCHHSGGSRLAHHLVNGAGNGIDSEHKGTTTCKKKCPCEECSITRLTSSLLTPDLYEEIGLKHMQDGGPAPGQLSALDTYLQSINPPDLSSSSSECSSEGDTDEVIPIFSRSDLPGLPSRSDEDDEDDDEDDEDDSEDSDDSDDLDSESSPSASHDGPYDDTEGEGSDDGGATIDRVHGDGSPAKDKSKNGKDEANITQKESGTPVSRPCECNACTASHNNAKLSTSSPSTVATEKLDLTSHSPASYLFYPNITNHQPLDLSHHGITAKHPLIHPHLYNLTSQKPTKLSNHTQPTTFQPSGLESPSSDTVLRDHLAAHTYLYGDWNSAYENAKMILHSRGYGHDTDPDILQSVRAALQSNCKAGGNDKGVPLSPTSQGEKDPHCKQHSAKQHKESKKQKQGHVCTEACANTGLPTDGWGPGKEQLLAQFQQQQLQQQVLPPPPLLAESPKKSSVITTSRADSTSSAEMCAKHNLPVVKSQAQLSMSSSPSSKAPSISQQMPSQCTQMAGHFGNVPVTSSQANSHHSLLSAATSSGSGSTSDGSTIKSASSNKKKRPAPDSDDLPPGTEAHMGLHHTDHNLDNQLPCSHYSHSGVIDHQTGLCTSAMQTASSTPTSASVCSDPDCETHNFSSLNDDLCEGYYEDRGSSTTSSSRERESKHCDCCYCEFFGHGGPQPAPTSKNYTEIRDRLRLRLRERKTQPKDESPSDCEAVHDHEDHHLTERVLADDRALDELLNFINGENQRKTKSKAAKRQRQRQRKAEERAKLEEEKARHEEEKRKRAEREKLDRLEKERKEREAEKVLAKLREQQQLEQRMLDERLKQKQSKSEALSLQGGKQKNDKKKNKQQKQQAEAAAQEAKQVKKPDSAKQQVQQQQQQQKRQASQGKQPQQPHQNSATVTQSSNVSSSSALSHGKQQHNAPITKNQGNNTNNKKDKTKQPTQPQKVSTTTPTPLQNGHSTITANQNKNNRNSYSEKQQAQQENGRPDGNKVNNQQAGKQKGKKGSAGDDAKRWSTGSQQNGHNHLTKMHSSEEKVPSGDAKTQQQSKSQAGGKKVDCNHGKQEKIMNGGGDAPVVVNKRKQGRKKNKDGHNTSIDEIFMPKENVDMAEMDETERELEAFKRFCMASTPAPKKEKVNLNLKDLTIKK